MTFFLFFCFEKTKAFFCFVVFCAVLCCVVLCCAVLCCVVLCCVVLCCVVLCCAVLCCVVFCCAVLFCFCFAFFVSSCFALFLLRFRFLFCYFFSWPETRIKNNAAVCSHRVCVRTCTGTTPPSVLPVSVGGAGGSRRHGSVPKDVCPRRV